MVESVLKYRKNTKKHPENTKINMRFIYGNIYIFCKFKYKWFLYTFRSGNVSQISEYANMYRYFFSVGEQVQKFQNGRK